MLCYTLTILNLLSDLASLQAIQICHFWGQGFNKDSKDLVREDIYRFMRSINSSLGGTITSIPKRILTMSVFYQMSTGHVSGPPMLSEHAMGAWFLLVCLRVRFNLKIICDPLRYSISWSSKQQHTGQDTQPHFRFLDGESSQFSTTLLGVKVIFNGFLCVWLEQTPTWQHQDRVGDFAHLGLLWGSVLPHNWGIPSLPLEGVLDYAHQCR